MAWQEDTVGRIQECSRIVYCEDQTASDCKITRNSFACPAPHEGNVAQSCIANHV